METLEEKEDSTLEKQDIDNIKRISDAVEKMAMDLTGKQRGDYRFGCILFLVGYLIMTFFPALEALPGFLFVWSMGYIIVKFVKRHDGKVESAPQNRDSERLLDELFSDYPPGNAERKREVRVLVRKLVQCEKEGLISRDTLNDYIVDIKADLTKNLGVAPTPRKADDLLDY